MIRFYHAGLMLLLGLCCGSFAQLLVWRLPRGEDWLFTPARCPHCGHSLAWRDMLPVLSWLLLQGRCRYCHNPISAAYLAGEVLLAVLWLGCYALYAGQPFFPVTLALTFSLVVVAFIDGQTMEIPDGIHLFLLGCGLAWNLWNAWAGHSLWRENLVGFFCVSGLLLVLSLLTGGGVGGGDIKLTAVCGLILGWQRILLALAFATIFCAMIMLPPALLRRQGGKKLIPFGPFLAAGIYLALLFGQGITSLYMGWR